MSTPPAPLRVALANGSFEQPVVTGVEILPDSSQTQAPKRVPGWLTTTPEPLTATSNEQVTQVNPAADLAAVKAADGTGATLVLRAKATEAGPVVNTATATANEKDPDTTGAVTICVEPAPSCCDPCATRK
ncbi:hypothetical protein ACIA74_11215 [Streptomyces sp. NPDC051658]|uniref:hypothetical protein n=1 Tax=Streptomyces sp. NPDC051658 TaxID=3365667 RepID=UPI00378F6A89